ncbi:LCCL domain-containing protein [Cryptosporidium muris RN66]|uniref:LCCL domain-containing protein n=1 Tax=Cryptosporidium muris (strain RN66) TaxID=441375 RepID=B6AHP2_CRYMR|nr:LCCL domain-containing protein [Cryptosporidium muris RN66]EEA07737.1 LCCL domain-containing protein [Cryptosporidium muris RN66]|eukprot:XP_002142086.1 LCCL domain-containing protein [Cryptosporidium muris RN66]
MWKVGIEGFIIVLLVFGLYSSGVGSIKQNIDTTIANTNFVPNNEESSPSTIDSQLSNETKIHEVKVFEADVTNGGNLNNKIPASTSKISKAYNPLKSGELFIIPLNNAIADNYYHRLGSDGVEIFLPENGIKRGVTHWLSDGNAIKNDIVHFTGILLEPTLVSGILINWASTPGEVRIDVSKDGSNFQEAVGWTKNRLASKEMEQKLYFKEHPIKIQKVRIGMRIPIFNFFGINFAGLLVIGSPIVQFTSGITTMTEEYCLQIEDGNIHKVGAELVLGSCIEAIASGDSREIFGFNSKGQIFNPISKLCIQLKDNNVGTGGTLVLDECSYTMDGRGLFELLPNNQLRLMRGGNLCLSSPGDKTGIINVALNAAASASSIRKTEPEYSPSMAVDNKDSTFWLSEDILENSSSEVYFKLDLGVVLKLQDIYIDWKYPASAFSIDLSSDNITYTPVISISNNGLSSTGYSLEGRKARYVKIALLSLGNSINKKSVYGIKQVRIFSTTMRSIVEDCNIAKEHQDGRDKVFPQPVVGENYAPGLSLKSQGEIIKKRLIEVQGLSGHISTLLPKLETCKSTASGREVTLKTQVNKLGLLSEQLEKLIYDYSLEYKFTKPLIGNSYLFPAEDCVAIKNDRKGYVLSGFFYVKPFCTTKPIRVFCDMDTGNTIYPVETHVNSARSVMSVCSQVGLKPLLLRDKKKSIKGIKLMLKMMGVNKDRRVIPLTHDYGCDHGETCAVQFLQLDSHIQSFISVSESNKPEIVLCSPNTNFQYANDAISLECNSRFADILALNKAPLLASILVKCPTTCNPESDGVVIGTDVYRDDSSVCISAMHANTLNRNTGLLQITPIEGLDSYGATKRFGVSSISYLGKKWSKSFVTSKYESLCPYNSSLSMLLSFIQLESKQENDPPTNMTYSDSMILPLGLGTAVDTFEAINRIKRYMNIIGGISYTSAMKETIGRSQVLVSRVRSKLKPTQIVDYHTRLAADNILLKLHTVSNILYYHMENLLETIVEHENLLKEVMELKATQTGFNSFDMPISNFIHFGELFEEWDSPGVTEGVGNWRILYEPIGGGGRSGLLGQTSPVGPPTSSKQLAIGTFARLKYKKFYDIDYNTDIYIDSYEGSIGLTFRMINFERYYLLEFSQQKSGGFKRLIRVIDGEKKLLGTKYDGGYISGSWHHVRILLSGPRIQIWVSTEISQIDEEKKYSSPVKVFDIYDNWILSGSIGFFSSGIKGGVYFDNIHVQAKPCTKSSSLGSLLSSHPPAAPVCSNYKSGSFGGVHNEFMFIDPEYSYDGPSNWEFRSNIGGLQTRSLVQTSNIHSISSDKIGTHAILGGNRQCNTGIYEYSFFPQCPDGIIGGIIHYKSSSSYMIFEMGSHYSRIRVIGNGIIRTLAMNMLVGYQLGTWNNIEIQFGTLGTSILASTNNYGKTQLLYTGSPLGLYDGSVGLSTYKCPGVAFQSIQLRPLTIGTAIAGLFLEEAQNTNITQSDSSITNIDFSSNTKSPNCTAIHARDRKEDCERLLGDDQCEANYCSYCCENSMERTYTELLRCKQDCHKQDTEYEQSKAILKTLDTCHSEESINLYTEKCQRVPAANIEAQQTWTNQFVCFVDLCYMCCNTQPLESEVDETSLAECYLQCILLDYKNIPVQL